MGQQAGELFRWIDPKLQQSFLNRMRESQPPGMEGLARQGLYQSARFLLQASGFRAPHPPAIGGVADYRVSDMGEMHPHLMGAAGGEDGLHERDFAEFLPHFNLRMCLPGRPCRRGNDGHLLAIRGLSADGGLDSKTRPAGLSPDEGEVMAVNLSFLEGAGESAVCGIFFGDDEKARGILIQTMEDAGAKGAADSREPISMRKEGIHQGSAFPTCAGVDDQAGGLVDYHDVSIFMENI